MRSRWQAPLQLELPGFEGSVDSLLQLVSRHKLPANDVPLSSLTEQFLKHINDAEALDLELAGDLIATSARLMVLKSASLLSAPADTETEGDSGDDVKLGLEVVYGPAVAALGQSEGMEAFVSLSPPDLDVRRHETYDPRLLVSAWSGILTRGRVPASPVHVPAFVSIETAVSGFIRALKGGATGLFSQITRGKSRKDAAIHFLAMVELLRQGRISAHQEKPFDDISLEWTETARRSSTRAG